MTTKQKQAFVAAALKRAIRRYEKKLQAMELARLAESKAA